MINVFESPAKLDAFGAKLMPILQEMGIEAKPTVFEIYNSLKGNRARRPYKRLLRTAFQGDVFRRIAISGCEGETVEPSSELPASNFHAATLRFRENDVHILCNAIYPDIGFTQIEPRSKPVLPFADAQVYEKEFKVHGFEPLSAQRVDVRRFRARLRIPRKTRNRCHQILEASMLGASDLQLLGVRRPEAPILTFNGALLIIIL